MSKTTNVQPLKWTLAAALDYIHKHALALCYSDASAGIEVYSGPLKIPIGVRRAVHKHADEIKRMMQAGDTRVCPNPYLHRHYWRCNRKKALHWCAICKQLDTLYRIDEALQAA